MTRCLIVNGPEEVPIGISSSAWLLLFSQFAVPVAKKDGKRMVPAVDHPQVKISVQVKILRHQKGGILARFQHICKFK